MRSKFPPNMILIVGLSGVGSTCRDLLLEKAVAEATRVLNEIESVDIPFISRHHDPIMDEAIMIRDSFIGESVKVGKGGRARKRSQFKNNKW